MKAITVRQPWAWAIAAGHKTTENRSQPTRYRGPLLIHAGVGWSTRGAANTDVLAAATTARVDVAPASDPFTRGAVIAVADLADCHPDGDCCRPWGESQYTEAGGRTRHDVWHYTLEDIRALPSPVHVTGRLGLWLPPDHVERAVLAQLGATA